jgi:hypothetical protein
MVESRPSRDRRSVREPGPAAKRARLAPWIVAALAALTYAGTLGADCTLDDVEIVRDDARLASLRTLPRLYADDYWGHVRYGDHGLYRPTTLATFAVQRAPFGIAPGRITPGSAADPPLSRPPRAGAPRGTRGRAGRRRRS